MSGKKLTKLQERAISAGIKKAIKAAEKSPVACVNQLWATLELVTRVEEQQEARLQEAVAQATEDRLDELKAMEAEMTAEMEALAQDRGQYQQRYTAAEGEVADKLKAAEKKARSSWARAQAAEAAFKELSKVVVTLMQADKDTQVALLRTAKANTSRYRIRKEQWSDGLVEAVEEMRRS
jgi:hypothetical protein